VESNFVKDKLIAGKASVGTFLNLCSPMAAEAMIGLGYEWAVVDTEHSTWDLADTALTFAAIEAKGGIPMARTWDHSNVAISRLLDAGALGLVIPHVSTAQSAAQFADVFRYPPIGHRSVGSSRATLLNNKYRTGWANDNVMLIPQIEDPEGVSNAYEIASTEGVDAVFIGPNDLALEMGLTTNDVFSHPDHIAAIKEILNGAKKAGKPAGLSVPDGLSAKQFIEDGFTMIDLSNDFRLLQKSAYDELSKATS